MTRFDLHGFFLSASALALAAFLPQASRAQEQPLPAERLPLAAQSLLLDAYRTTEGRIVAVGERGHIVTSSDGREWSQAEQVPTRSTLTAVTGSGNDLWAGGHDTVILHSGDGGRNWSLQYQDIERRQPIMDMVFVDSERGYAVGAYGLFMFTEDGGASWDEAVVSEDEWHLNGLVDLGQGNLVITGESGYSYSSEDGGETWSIVDMPYPGSMFGAVRAGSCVVAYGLRGNVQRSCDRGVSWEALSAPTENSLAGASSSQETLIIVGNSGQILLRSDESGFRSTVHPSGVDFAAVLPLEDGSWLLFGEDGAHVYPPGGSE